MSDISIEFFANTSHSLTRRDRIRESFSTFPSPRPACSTGGVCPSFHNRCSGAYPTTTESRHEGLGTSEVAGTGMDYRAFHKQLFAPLGDIGPIDAKSIVAIIGFDAGGPFGRYELLATCGD